jgi:hypothetical protein
MSDFLLKTEKGIESVITTFSKNGSSVTLYPMVHFGIFEFYDDILLHAADHNQVLYESLGASMDDDNIYTSLLTKDYSDTYAFSMPEIFMMTVALYQSTFARVFGLAEQSFEQLIYSRNKNFIVADINVEEQKIDEQYSLDDVVFDGERLFQNYLGSLLRRIDTLNFMDMLANRSTPEVLRPIYENEIADLIKNSDLAKILALSEQRESHVINLLDSIIDKCSDIGIIYGSFHMSAYEGHMIKNGYQKSVEKSVLAIPNVPPRLAKNILNI